MYHNWFTFKSRVPSNSHRPFILWFCDHFSACKFISKPKSPQPKPCIPHRAGVTYSSDCNFSHSHTNVRDRLLEEERAFSIRCPSRTLLPLHGVCQQGWRGAGGLEVAVLLCGLVLPSAEPWALVQLRSSDGREGLRGLTGERSRWGNATLI